MEFTKMEFAKCKPIMINDREYYIHEEVLDNASIFSVLNDQSDTKEIVNIEIPCATQSDIIMVISLLYNIPCFKIFKDDHKIDTIVHFLKIMTYIGTKIEIINEYICYMKKRNDSDINIIEKIVDLDTYDYCLNILLDCCNHILYRNAGKNIIEKIKTKNSFPISFKKKIIIKLMYNAEIEKDYDIILFFNSDININHDTRAYNILTGPHNYYKISERIDSLYYFYLGIMKKSICTCTCDDSLVPPLITQILIDKKPIEMVDYEKTHSRGTAGGNLLMSICVHISKIMLGLEKI